MFTPPDKQEDGQIISEAEGSGQAEEVAEEDIHTMPSKFLKPSSMPKKQGRWRWIILAVLLIVVLGGVIYAVLAFLGSQTPSVSQTPVNQAPAVIETNQNQNQNVNVNQRVDTATGRDLTRLADVSALRTALNLYFKTYQIFPNTLNSLLGNFLTELPLDPAEEQSYSYQADADQQDYRLLFSLEAEAEWGILLLPEGNYFASAEGIFPEATELPQEIGEGLNANTNSSVPATAPPVVGTAPSLGLDSDGDQLTDIEENIYRTNATLADTDEDGYTDATEILNFYDPLDPQGRLVNSGLTELYTNPTYNYSVVYPEAWVVRSLSANNTEVIFTSNTGEFIEVIVQANPLGLSAMNWYLGQNPTASSASLETLTIDGFPAVATPDGLTAYLSVGSNIYIIAYNIGTQQQMNFHVTYQLFLRSFLFLDAE